MKINRAIGAILFIALAHLVLGDMLSAFSRAFVASMETAEVASQTATLGLLQLH